MAAGMYGGLLGVVLLGLTKLLPQPTGAIVFWGPICLQLSWTAMTCWRRTRLPFATAGMINGAIMSVGLVALALMGQPFPNLTPGSWVLVVCATAIGHIPDLRKTGA